MGPDAARYLIAGSGRPVARPFNLRWLLPAVCGTDRRIWHLVYVSSWPMLAAGVAWYAYGLLGGWQIPLATAALVVSLPGVWGPAAVRPVGIDLPAMAWTAIAAGFWTNGYPVLAIIVVVWAACIKETQPIWLALWVWSPWPLVALVAPAIAAIVRKPAIDEMTARPNLRQIHDHPIRTAILSHAGRWRDGWLMVAPWGACLAALYAPTWQLGVVLAVAYAQLLVATDSVRLYQTAAGPVVALVAAQTIPVEWLPLAVIVGGVVWWRTPELI